MPYDKKRIKGQLLYKGYLSPSPGQLPNKLKDVLKKVYSSCRVGTPRESGAAKTKCSKIAWSVVNKVRNKYK